MKRISNPNAREALNQMKMEIANELDARLTDEERVDGTTMTNLVNRAEKKIEKKEKEMF